MGGEGKIRGRMKNLEGDTKQQKKKRNTGKRNQKVIKERETKKYTEKRKVDGEMKPQKERQRVRKRATSWNCLSSKVLRQTGVSNTCLLTLSYDLNVKWYPGLELFNAIQKLSAFQLHVFVFNQ